MPAGFVFQCHANLLTSTPYVLKIEIAINLTRSAHAHERQLGFTYSFNGIASSAEASRLCAVSNDLADPWLNNWASAFVNEVDLYADWVYADDFVTILCETTSRHRTNIAQPKNTNFQLRFLPALKVRDTGTFARPNRFRALSFGI
jgi:ribosome-binding factor A